jgi:hypothetical protein
LTYTIPGGAGSFKDLLSDVVSVVAVVSSPTSPRRRECATEMIFLRKRSRSQSSNDAGRDGFRNDRKESIDGSVLEGRYSGVSEVSSRLDDYELNDSCV